MGAIASIVFPVAAGKMLLEIVNHRQKKDHWVALLRSIP
jgi:hypothetical protein